MNNNDDKDGFVGGFIRGFLHRLFWRIDSARHSHYLIAGLKPI